MTIFFRRLVHYAVYVVGGIVILLSLIALAVRFLVMPEIGHYRPEIEAIASKAVGMPVRIQDLRADWVHFNPHITLENVSLAPPGQPEPLHIGRVEATVSWFSLMLMEPHMAALDIYQPALDIRRDKTGTIFVAGIPVNRGGPSNPFPDWLLRQRTVTISDGRVTWLDAVRNAPPLVLDKVDFGLDNHFTRHRFGLTARPPAHAVVRLDIRGDLHGRAIEDLPSWRGQVYLRADGASAAALNTWSPWAQSAVHKSVGDVRFWLDFDKAKVQSVTGDVDLRDVAVSLADDLPEMAFSRISGRLGWTLKGQEQTYAVQALRFVTATGQTAEPANFKVSFTPTPADKIESARVEADSLRLEALTALSGAIPLPRQAHDWIANVNPHGFIEHIDFNWLGKDQFHLITRFREVGMNATRVLPGFSGLNGDIEADDKKGHLKVDSQGFHLVYGSVFRQPLDLTTLSAEADWSGTPAEGYRVALEKCTLGNPDLDGSVHGSLTLPPGKSPVIDLEAQLTRGRGDAVWRYLPYQVADEAYDWLKASIVGGTSPDTRLILKGPLDRFPFENGDGLFQVKVRMHDGVLQYAPDWPRITGVDGWLTFQGIGMTLTAERGDILGTKLVNVRAAIPDLWHADAMYLQLKGRAIGPTANFLDFIRQSPVDEYMDHFTETMKAVGNGTLDLTLHMPLDDVRNTQVTGRMALANNDITLDDRLPPLTQVSGNVGFTDTSVKAAGITARLFDQPLVIGLSSEHGGRVKAKVNGVLDSTLLGRWLPARLSKRITGSTPFEADISLKQHTADLKLDSKLAGLAIDLPAPLGKKAEFETPFSLNVQDRGDDHPPVTFKYGDIVAGNLQPGGADHTRLSVMLGGLAAPAPTADGITVAGSLRRLDLDTWRRLDLGQSSGNGPAVRDINVTFNELQAFDRTFHDINLQAKPVQGAWNFKLNGQEAAGEARYGPQPGVPGDVFSGRFKKLVLTRPTAASAESRPLDPADLPREIDLGVDSFTYDKQNLGNLTLKLAAAKDGFNVEDLALATPETQVKAQGWLSTSPFRRTRLDIDLQSSNVGNLLQRFGYDDAVKGGVLSVKGKMDWLGRPEELKLSKLNGRFNMELKNGRFLQLDPGAAKLLGILSLQALPRRITLDFRDVFSEGFAFDNIGGDILLDRGVGYLPDLTINGPAASIHMKGQIDLSQENQDLRLHIQPRLDESVAVGAALLGGPVIGVGTLVATKILKNPVSQAASFEYLVTGTWADPVVTKLARPVAETPAGKP